MNPQLNPPHFNNPQFNCITSGNIDSIHDILSGRGNNFVLSMMLGKVKDRDINNMNALEYLCYSNDIDGVKRFLEREKDYNIRINNNLAFNIACYNSNIEIVDLLLETNKLTKEDLLFGFICHLDGTLNNKKVCGIIFDKLMNKYQTKHPKKEK